MLIQANDASKKIAPIINNSWIFCVGYWKCIAVEQQ